MKSDILSDWALPILLISGAYLLGFAVTFALVMPLQDAFTPSFGNYASLVFLPHGVRVVAAWLYGWRSLLFLAPGAILTHSYLYGSAGFSADYMMAVFFGVFCAALSFWFFALLGMDFRLHKSNRVNWRDIMLAGGAASVLNSVGTKLFFNNDIATASARFLGDVTGMIVSMFILMLIFRVLRRIRGQGGV
jgi:arginine exporter protein ArgO